MLLIDYIELQYFYNEFQCIINTHTLFRKFKVKGKKNPWGFPQVGNLSERDVAWVRKTKAQAQFSAASKHMYLSYKEKYCMSIYYLI